MASPPLVIVIASVRSEDAIDLSRELILTKSALLYADKVVLASPKALLLNYLERFQRASPRERLPAALRIVEEMPEARRALRRLQELETRPGARNPDQRRIREALTNHMLEASLQFGEDLQEQVLGRARVDEVRRAIDAGVLELDPLSGPASPTMDDIGETLADIARGALRVTRPDLADELLSRPTHGLDSSDASDRLRDLIRRGLQPGASDYMLFDGHAAIVAKALAEFLDTMGQAVGASATGAIGVTFLSYLDALPDAPMDEVLDVRRQLTGPLMRFRAAVGELSSTFENRPYDDAFPQEALELYRAKVAPALVELAELQNEMGLRRQLSRELIGSADALRTAALAFGATSIGQFDSLIGALSGVAAAAVTIAGAVHDERDRLQLKQRQNAFFFEYEAQRRLSQ